MMKSLNVLFIWHMHQPLYRATDSEPFRMPWVRLHGTKDYLGMADLVSESPAFRMTFNFTPVLWDQIEAYSTGASDRELEVSLKPAGALSLAERQYILKRMFTGNSVSLINPYPRYAELFDRYGRGGEEAAHRMTEKDITDLIVWRMLAWINPETRISHPFISRLMQKSSGFSEQEKHELITTSRTLLGQIPDKFRILDQLGQVSMSTTPYYHPILPILIDSETARECVGFKGDFPERFHFGADAEWHVKEAINRHRQIFDDDPSGMWPAEGSVSQDACALFAANRINWIASDEAILEKSLEQSLQRDPMGFMRRVDLLYQPYRIETQNGSITMVFRDHYLSDLLGFDYQSLNHESSINDFINRLKYIRDHSQALPVDPCVALILDGENAWEHYSDGGFPFLKKLFHAIANEPGLHLENMTTYLNRIKEQALPVLTKLSPGSWINGDFSIWIGQEEENLAWKYLVEFQDSLEKHEKSTGKASENAHLCLRKAQGSDSFWWFGDVHYTSEKLEFDELFREYLIKGYESVGLIPDKKLFVPLSIRNGVSDAVSYPKNLISPRIDGDIKSYFDWYGCGSVSFRSHYSAMHAVSERPLFSGLKFGFDLQRLYLRMDPGPGFEGRFDEEIRIDIIFGNFSIRSDLSIALKVSGNGVGSSVCALKSLNGLKVSEEIEAVFDRILEISIPFRSLSIGSDSKVSFHVEIWLGDLMRGRIPDLSEIEFFTPTEDYDSILWRV